VPVEAKPLFRPDVLRPYVDEFTLPPRVEQFRPKLEHWAELIRTERLNNFRESEILPSFLHDFFETLLGYAGPASGGTRFTISVEKHVEIDGKFADAVLGDFNGKNRFVVAVEGKGPKDALAPSRTKPRERPRREQSRCASAKQPPKNRRLHPTRTLRRTPSNSDNRPDREIFRTLLGGARGYKE
jgi:hypothetical protein